MRKIFSKLTLALLTLTLFIGIASLPTITSATDKIKPTKTPKELSVSFKRFEPLIADLCTELEKDGRKLDLYLILEPLVKDKTICNACKSLVRSFLNRCRPKDLRTATAKKEIPAEVVPATTPPSEEAPAVVSAAATAPPSTEAPSAEAPAEPEIAETVPAKENSEAIAAEDGGEEGSEIAPTPTVRPTPHERLPSARAIDLVSRLGVGMASVEVGIEPVTSAASLVAKKLLDGSKISPGKFAYFDTLVTYFLAPFPPEKIAEPTPTPDVSALFE